jgi:carbonic anhydrase
MKFRSIMLITMSLCSFMQAWGADGSTITPDQAIQKLVEGNKRFVNNKLEHCEAAQIKRESTAAGQAPFAIVLGCSDSRVPPEIVFDQSIGDLFTVRVAGNVAGPTEFDSIVFAVRTFRSSVILVLGHESCGAVNAVLDKQAGDFPVVEALIQPAVKQFQSQPANNLVNAIKANVKNAVETLKNHPEISKAIKANKLKVVGGYYNFQTGQVDLI